MISQLLQCMMNDASYGCAGTHHQRCILGSSGVFWVLQHLTPLPRQPSWGWSTCIPAALVHGSPLFIQCHLEALFAASVSALMAFFFICSFPARCSFGRETAAYFCWMAVCSPTLPPAFLYQCLVLGILPFKCLFKVVFPAQSALSGQVVQWLLTEWWCQVTKMSQPAQINHQLPVLCGGT